jgi:hypothetical protein
MHQLLYVSSTRRDFPQQELKEILAVARANNVALGVTGLLLYVDGGFLQVLEGERDVLHMLYTQIAKDTRHWEPKLLLDHEGERSFSQWSMGFKDLGDGSADAGLVGITQSAIKGLIKPGGAQPILDILIKTFCQVQGAV